MEAMKDLTALGARMTTIELDVSDLDSIERLKRRVVEICGGRLDILVNNAWVSCSIICERTGGVLICFKIYPVEYVRLPLHILSLTKELIPSKHGSLQRSIHRLPEAPPPNPLRSKRHRRNDDVCRIHPPPQRKHSSGRSENRKCGKRGGVIAVAFWSGV